MENSTPMLKQYQEIKARHPHSILFFRLGDFYEMFFEDAQVASKILDLVLTSRSNGKSLRVPMCGIPYHSADGYVSKLIKAGHKVSICEQVEDPALAQGIVKRDVVRTITSGTFLDDQSYDSRYILSLVYQPKTFGLSFTEPTSGTILTNQYSDQKRVVEIISKIPVYECIYPESQESKIKEILKHPILRLKNIIFSPYADWNFNPDTAQKNLCEHFKIHNLSAFGINDLPCAFSASGALLEYLKEMNKQPLRHIDKVSLYTDEDYVFISPAACYGLELDSLLKAIDRTLTSGGKRKLRNWLYHPLKDINSIHQRQNAIGLLRASRETRLELENLLKPLPDLERSISRLSCGYTSAKDILAIRNCLVLCPSIKKTTDPLAVKNSLFNVTDLPSLRDLLDKTINPDLPLSNSTGKVIKPGYHKELDGLRDIQENGRQWLRNLQAQEIKRTGINSLKIGFNSVFGYYIEITKSNLDAVPADYIRKQTLVNGERYITPALKEFEEKILSAEEKIARIENEIITELCREILNQSSLLHDYASNLATLDVLYALALLSLQDHYIVPEISPETMIDIKEGRHPVVEKTLQGNFVPNDTLLDCEENHLIILTGPNMAGKSTYIRQTAILVILSQMGSYIPALSARIGIVDKVFTRIGAHDDISKGQSTFMVEMNETADILHNLTPRSLIILDEIGRGTSTYDGLSLAWALAEHLQKKQVRTLFATHFHELTALAENSVGVKNYNVAVKEWKDEIVFLHKIIPGSTDDSYGIHVAKLAGIPTPVINRAKEILSQLELQNDLKEKIRNSPSGENQLSLFSRAPQAKPNNDPVADEIRAVIESMDINSLTPLGALNLLQELKRLIREK